MSSSALVLCHRNLALTGKKLFTAYLWSCLDLKLLNFDMEQGEYLFSGNAWFKEHLDGPDGHLWRKARRMFLFNQDLSSALNLFKFDYRAIETISRPEGTILRGSRTTELDPNDIQDSRRGRAWNDDAKNSVRTLLDRIVTLWRPKYLSARRINAARLHPTLTPLPLQYVKQTHDTTDDGIDDYDVETALEAYQASLVPLHYHELWSEIVNDFKDVDTKLAERETVINVELFYDKSTLDETEDTALIFGTNRIIYTDRYTHLSKKLGLFDIVLIKINNFDYFGMIVHVEQIRIKVARGDEHPENRSNAEADHRNLEFDLQTTIGIYVSHTCSNAIQQLHSETNNKKLPVFKLSNITSSRRMISAIYSIGEWSQHRSILKPMSEDIYFQLPEGYDSSNITPANGFNLAQSKAIAIAECMFDDLYDRMHLIHGPPGTGKSRTIAGMVLKLLKNLSESGRKKKILLCAPSNNACDELSRRILDEIRKQEIPFSRGTLVRIGCKPPDDRQLCNHFLDFMVLQDVVEVLKSESRPSDTIAQETEKSIMRHAKIVISTLNYCGSARMQQLKSSTAFVIIDEASQSLEADFLLPLRFKCNKVILVGDPLQLPPCVLSEAGKDYGLSQSLHSRLHSIFEDQPDGPITMLDTQYRMHPDICQFPSDHFYSGQLSTDVSVLRRMRHFTLESLFLYNITNSNHECDLAGSSLNQVEAEYIRQFCQELIQYLAQQPDPVVNNDDDDESDDDDGESDEDESHTTSSLSNSNYSHENDNEEEKPDFQALPNNDPRSIKVQQRIAVITPYKAQVRLLRSYLPPYIEIMTADSAQGKEKDIVILSCVRSGDSIGFLDDMHRLNVMLTRSKYALYVFGNLTKLAQQHESWDSLVSHARFYRAFSDVRTIPLELPYRDQ